MLLFLLACVTSDNFPTRFGAEVCERYEECVKAAFDATYDDMGECIDEFATLDLGEEGCSFDAKAASECLGAVRDVSCDALFVDGEGFEVCGEVYTDCP